MSMKTVIMWKKTKKALNRVFPIWFSNLAKPEFFGDPKIISSNRTIMAAIIYVLGSKSAKNSFSAIN